MDSGGINEETKQHRHPPLTVKVLVIDLKTNEVVREHKMNYNDKSMRRWLSKLCIWAWNNGKSVETLNIKDDV